MKKYIIRHKQEFILRIVLSVIGILFVCLFSYSTSPLYSGYYGGDSAQFLTIGKAWMLGKIPYKEMFDHKGPFIFLVLVRKCVGKVISLTPLPFLPPYYCGNSLYWLLPIRFPSIARSSLLHFGRQQQKEHCTY